MKTLQKAVEEWLEERDNVEDCGDSCDGHCWFSLSAEQRRAERIKSFTEMLEDEGDLL